MTDEYYVKARLISQEYLLPNGAKYKICEGMNFNQINAFLDKSDNPRDQEARFYIRAIPSFFWLVDQAKDNGNINSKERLFSSMYSWYWVHIIEERIKGCEDNRQFREIKWIKSAEDEENVRREYNRLLSTIGEQKRITAK